MPLCGCDPSTMGPKEQSYTMAGCAGGLLTGLVAGLGFGHGNAGAAVGGAAVGTAAGCLAGNYIGRQLDAQDRARQEAAIYAALNAPPAARPRSYYWQSNHGTGNHGSAQVVPHSQTKTASGSVCQEVTETAYIHGSETQQPTKYCRNANGDWTEQA
jgi:surface antigen